MRAARCLLARRPDPLLAAVGSPRRLPGKHLIDPTPPAARPNLCHRCKIRTRRRRRPKNCSRANRRRFPGRLRSIGGYFDGCLAGAVSLPITGPTWQVMRPSRNRNWGNPQLVRFIERLSKNAKKVGWNGLWLATCRSRAVGRCSPPHQPSSRPRRRYLVYADA
jgi:hypothetical protein